VTGTGGRRASVLAAVLLLAVLVAIVYLRTGAYPYINLDDPDYVPENVRVLGGLSAGNVAWAFSSFHAANWHPLTWLSHMADVSLFGAAPGPAHLVNVAFHLANVLLLFLGLSRMTGALWRSAFAAALFAVHPLNVESVAWVAERKNVLSTLFLLLAIGAHVRYAEKPLLRRYAAVALLFALSLLCKPMAVTLPLLLLLVDLWPLGRKGLPRLVAEKAPLLALSAASSIVTVIAQAEGGALRSLGKVPVGLRLGNAAASCSDYLSNIAWPSKLALFYPLPAEIPPWRVAVALAIVAGLTALAVRARREKPYLLAGWLWFLVSLLPVIGLVQVGNAARADRYVYVPAIGIFVAGVWAVADAAAGTRIRRIAAAVAGVVAVAAFTGVALRQASLWRDGEVLFANTLSVMKENWLVANNLGMIHESRGDHRKAAELFREVIRINPGYAPAWNNLGMATDAAGRPVEAVRYYREALRLDPALAEAWNNLAASSYRLGLVKESVDQLREAIRLRPEYPDAWFNLGLAYGRLGYRREAAACYREALRLRPGFQAARAALDAGNRSPEGAQ
jgi:tetratricopeptide (TPR) repeat protein